MFRRNTGQYWSGSAVKAPPEKRIDVHGNESKVRLTDCHNLWMQKATICRYLLILEIKLLVQKFDANLALSNPRYLLTINPFTPESDQCQNSLAASQEIWHHTVWRTWLFIAYSDVKWLYYKFSLHHLYNHFLKGCENTLFELRSERVNFFIPLRVWESRVLLYVYCIARGGGGGVLRIACKLLGFFFYTADTSPPRCELTKPDMSLFDVSQKHQTVPRTTGNMKILECFCPLGLEEVFASCSNTVKNCTTKLWQE